MTTAVVQAFEKAGVQVSVKRRLWAYLIDNPARSTKEIAGALSLAVDSLGVELRGMVARGMLEITIDPRSVAGRHGGRVRRNILLYTVPPSMRQQYELLPLLQKGAPVARKTAKTAPVTPQAQPALDNRPVFSPPTFVQDLTLKEAKAVFDYLGRMFK